jgi:hypothetical protein
MKQVDRQNTVVEIPPGCPEDPVEMWAWAKEHPREMEKFVSQYEKARGIKTVIVDLTNGKKKALFSLT